MSTCRAGLAPLLILFLAIPLLLAQASGCAGKAGPKTAGQGAPASPAEMERLGDEQARQGHLDAALSAYDVALKAGAPREGLVVKKGAVLLAKHAWTDALAAFQEALATGPDNVQALVGAGHAAIESEDGARAKDYLSRAVALRPDLPKAHSLLGVALDKEGDHDAAARQYGLALTLGGDKAEAYNNMGRSRLMAEDPEGALQDFRKALAERGDPLFLNNMGDALCRLGRYDEAFQAFAQAGGEATAYNNVGVFLLQSGQRGKAAQYFEKALAASPTYYAKAADNLRRATEDDRAGTPEAPRDGAASASAVAPIPQPATPLPSATNPTSFLPMIQPDPSAPSAKAGNPSSPGSGQAAPGSYTLFESSWRTAEKAEQRAAELAALNLKVMVAPVDLGPKGVWHRVLLGPFQSAEEALRALNALPPSLGHKTMKALRKPTPAPQNARAAAPAGQPRPASSGGQE